MEMAVRAYPDGLFRNDSLTVNFKTDVDLKDAYIAIYLQAMVAGVEETNLIRSLTGMLWMALA